MFMGDIFEEEKKRGKDVEIYFECIRACGCVCVCIHSVLSRNKKTKNPPKISIIEFGKVEENLWLYGTRIRCNVFPQKKKKYTRI